MINCLQSTQKIYNMKKGYVMEFVEQVTYMCIPKWLDYESLNFRLLKFGARGSQGESFVGQRSYLAFFAGEAASGWGLWLLLGTGQYLGVHGCSHFGPCRCCLY